MDSVLRVSNEESIEDRHTATMAGVRWMDEFEHPLALLYTMSKLQINLNLFVDLILMRCQCLYPAKPANPKAVQ